MKANLVPTDKCIQECTKVLSDADSYLGSGAYSQVHALNSDRVVKFSRNLPTLQFLQKLSGQSIHFPTVDMVVENQAIDEEGFVYHAALVERLEEFRSPWVFDIVTLYRQGFRPDTAMESMMQLLSVSYKIASGGTHVPESQALGIVECLKILANECLLSDFLADLRADSNIMKRANGVMVIADPAHPIDTCCC